jgi:uncharacterized protein YraI
MMHDINGCILRFLNGEYLRKIFKMKLSLISCLTGFALTAFATSLSARPVIAIDLANLRSGPGVNYSVLGVIPPQAPLDVSSCSNKWCQVLWQGQTGYISSSLLASSPPAAMVSTAPPATVDVTPPPAYPYDSYDNRPFRSGYDELYDGGFYGDGWYAGSWGPYLGPGFWGSGGWAGPSFRGPGLWGLGFRNGSLHSGRAYR